MLHRFTRLPKVVSYELIEAHPRVELFEMLGTHVAFLFRHQERHLGLTAVQHMTNAPLNIVLRCFHIVLKRDPWLLPNQALRC